MAIGPAMSHAEALEVLLHMGSRLAFSAHGELIPEDALRYSTPVRLLALRLGAEVAKQLRDGSQPEPA